MNDDIIAQLKHLEPLIEDVIAHGATEPDSLASLVALSLNPGDSYARTFLQERLAPRKTIAELFPDPFAPAPLPGEVDGPIRLGIVEGQDGNPVGMSEAELNRNIVIVGEAGGGKTSAVIWLLISILEAQ